MPGIESFDPRGRPDPVDRRALRPHRIHPVLEEGPEPGGEEHHLRDDEQDKAVTQAQPDDRGMVTRAAFGHHIHPPGEHHVNQAGKADQEQPGARAVHPKHRPEQHEKGRNRPKERPDRWRQDVIVVVLCLGHGQGFPRLILGQFTAPPLGAGVAVSAACSSDRGVS